MRAWRPQSASSCKRSFRRNRASAWHLLAGQLLTFVQRLRRPLPPLRGTGRRSTGSIRRRLTAWSTLPQGPEILDGALGVDL